jgi:hypothetical protein
MEVFSMRYCLLALTSAFVLVAGAAAAGANPQHPHKHQYKHHHHHGHTGKIHYGGRPGLGYWRRGPAVGYGFAFSSYRKDPFGADDYYDGGLCHYRKRHDFCYRQKQFTGFR